MNRAFMITVVVVGIGLLILSSALAGSAKDDLASFPSLDGRTPSGMVGFSRLLRAKGYQVVVDRSMRPKLSPGDVPVIIDLASKDKSDTEPASIFDPAQKWDDDPEMKLFRDRVLDHVRAGNTALVLTIDGSFQDATAASRPVAAKRLGDAKTLSITQAATQPSGFYPPSNTSTSLWSAGEPGKSDEWVVVACAEEKGQVFALRDASPLTNRFITQDDNAEFALALVQAAAPKASRLVALEASFGNGHSKGLAEWAGPWAQAAQTQAYLLIAVVAITLAVRFGTARDTRVTELGARSMVDAMSANLARLRNPAYAMSLFIDDVYERARVALRASVGTHRAQIAMQLPEALAQQLAKCEQVAGAERPKQFQRRQFEQDMVAEAVRLDELITAFEKDTRTRRLG